MQKNPSKFHSSMNVKKASALGVNELDGDGTETNRLVGTNFVMSSISTYF